MKLPFFHSSKKRPRLVIAKEKAEIAKFNAEIAEAEKRINKAKGLDSGTKLQGAALNSHNTAVKSTFQSKIEKLKGELTPLIELYRQMEEGGLLPEMEAEEEEGEETDPLEAAIGHFVQNLANPAKPLQQGEAAATGSPAELVIANLPAEIRTGIQTGLIPKSAADAYIDSIKAEVWEKLKGKSPNA